MVEEEGTYEDWTVEELREQAAARDIEGRSAMNKAELVAALEEDDAAEEGIVAEAVSATATVGSDVVVTVEDYKQQDLVAQALELEEPLRAAADSLAPGPNSDALKAAMRSAVRGLGHMRRALEQMSQMADR